MLFKFGKVISWLFSYVPSPFLSCGYDNFSKLSALKSGNWRFSLIQIPVVASRLHIVSLRKTSDKIRFDPIHWQGIANIPEYNLDNAQWENLKGKFCTHLNTLNEEDTEIEKEALLRHLDDEEKRGDLSVAKMSIYTALVMASVALITSKLSIKSFATSFVSSHPWTRIIILYDAYTICNGIACMFGLLMVRGVSKSSFGDLKEAAKKPKEYILQIYYDWQQRKRHSDLLVSYVSTIWDWIKMSILSFYILLVMYTPMFFKQVRPSNPDTHPPIVYTLNQMQYNKAYSTDAVCFASLILELHKGSIKHIMILHRAAIDPNVMRQLQEFYKQTLVCVYDETLDDDVLKIILEE